MIEVEIEFYNLGAPGLILYSVTNYFADLKSAIDFAKSIVEEGQGFSVYVE